MLSSIRGPVFASRNRARVRQILVSFRRPGVTWQCDIVDSSNRSLRKPRTMRRNPANALLVVLLAGFLLPLFASPGEALPACCRRDGKHHCHMDMGPNSGSTEREFRASATPCPYRCGDCLPNSARQAFISVRGGEFQFSVRAASSSPKQLSLFETAVPPHLQRGPPLFPRFE